MDIFCYARPKFLHCITPAGIQLILEVSVKGFHGCVIPTVPLSGHRLDKACLTDKVPNLRMGVVHPLVRMKDGFGMDIAA